MGTLRIRTDPEVEQALDRLTMEGGSRSDVVRAAILDADRARRKARLRAEAGRLRDDPADRAAAKDLAEELGDFGAW